MAQARSVLLLGAGFSRAVSAEMPMTDELGGAVAERLRRSGETRVPPRFEGGAFETWMSHLAEEQPFLTVPENLANRALFLTVSEAVAEVLGEQVQSVLSSSYPAWLPRLICLAHRQRTTVVTFNYDTLVECAVATGVLYDWGAAEPVEWTELTGDVPGWPSGVLRWGSTPADTFTLLKLHGSLNWYWVPEDTTGVSVARRVLPGSFGAPEPYSEQSRRRDVPGRAPFVVPPSTAKSSYYRNPFFREIWRQAFEAICGADRLVLVGYSLPLADLTVADMLREGLARSSADVTIVNPAACDVAERLAQLGVGGERLTLFDREQGSIEEFVSVWATDSGVDVAHDLRRLDEASTADPMLVVWGADQAAAVTALGGGGILVLMEPPRQPQVATRSRSGDKTDPLPSLKDALAACGEGPLRVLVPGHESQTVIGHTTATTDFGYGRGRWNILYPDGPYPSQNG